MLDWAQCVSDCFGNYRNRVLEEWLQVQNGLSKRYSASPAEFNVRSGEWQGLTLQRRIQVRSLIGWCRDSLASLTAAADAYTAELC